MGIFKLDTAEPIMDKSVFVAPTATVIGHVTIKKNSSIWFNTVIRGDGDEIVIGSGTNIQDLTMLHTDPGKPISIGNQTTIGHRCVIHGCTIGGMCMIGMGAIVMNGANVGNSCIVAAGSVILENAVIPPRSLVAGIPGRIKRTLKDSELAAIVEAAEIYMKRAGMYQSRFILKKTD